MTTRYVLEYAGTRYILPAGLALSFLDELPNIMSGQSQSFILKFDPEGEPRRAKDVHLAIYPGVPLAVFQEELKEPSAVTIL